MYHLSYYILCLRHFTSLDSIPYSSTLTDKHALDIYVSTHSIQIEQNWKVPRQFTKQVIKDPTSSSHSSDLTRVHQNRRIYFIYFSICFYKFKVYKVKKGGINLYKFIQLNTIFVRTTAEEKRMNKKKKEKIRLNEGMNSAEDSKKNLSFFWYSRNAVLTFFFFFFPWNSHLKEHLGFDREHNARLDTDILLFLHPYLYYFLLSSSRIHWIRWNLVFFRRYQIRRSKKMMLAYLINLNFLFIFSQFAIKMPRCSSKNCWQTN